MLAFFGLRYAASREGDELYESDTGRLDVLCAGCDGHRSHRRAELFAVFATSGALSSIDNQRGARRDDDPLAHISGTSTPVDKLHNNIRVDFALRDSGYR